MTQSLCSRSLFALAAEYAIPRFFLRYSAWDIRYSIFAILLAFFSSYSAIDVPVHFDSLRNGLKILIVPDTNVAIVSCRLYYFVGSMYEGPGTSGLSHMFEHMMFKGTQRLGTLNYRKEIPFMRAMDKLEAAIAALQARGIPETDTAITTRRQQIFSLLDQQRAYIKKDEIWQTYLQNGATNLNGWTADDLTAYIVTLPKNKVELFYWIESDRMRNPVLREFFSEREVVTEERRLRYENRPIARYWERLYGLFFTAHPYRIPTIGYMSDIRSYTRAKLEEHVHRYYTPDNALIVLAGNVAPAQAVKDIARYFGRIPRARQPKPEVTTREPAPLGETRFTVYDEVEPRIDLFFHTPGYPHDDLYRLDVMEGILAGRSGRLHERLVKRLQICTSAGAENATLMHNGYFHVWATLQAGADADSVEHILKDELTRLWREPPSDEEMLRNKNAIRMSFVTALKSLENLSDRLAWYQRLRSWKDLFEYPGKIESVTAESISPVAARYLRPEVCVVGRLLNKSKVESRLQSRGQ